ncbi:peptidylprolyl isomerase [candidate division TA06 bacterium]|uniref:Peptidyl-prolyl cis-trans isomerase n=1 Tax=candidate division TA06 bacterium TaxID=2250710 RepID=A0A660SAR7_UNCT6|nr:MAG: peptidylprolyl isomerase [candidate division TA06 bacterium]
MYRKLFVFIFAAMMLVSCNNNKGVKKVKNENTKPKYTLQEAEKTQLTGDEVVKITMKKGGEIYFILYPDKAPLTCKNFVYLTDRGFYNGLIFHRVVPNFVVQGGDPTGTGMGGPGYSIKAEFNDLHHLTGTVAMARSQDPNSAGSQFYICLSPQPHLDNNYTIFGQVVKGMDVVQNIQQGDTMAKVVIIHDSTFYKK